MGSRLIRIVSTVFGIGYMPLMPGTFASVLGLLIYVIFKGSNAPYLIATVVITALGFAVCTKAEWLFARKDPPQVVIDETAGMLITYAAIPFCTLNILMGFILFRGMDILKPYPIRRIEDLKGGKGVMLDDIAAALAANVVLRIIDHVFL